MSYRNTAITGFLYAKQNDKRKLLRVLKDNFDFVHSHGRGSWYSMLIKDLGDYETELIYMPEIVKKLHNIIQHSWTLSMAYETRYHKKYQWKIKGYLEK